MSEQLEQNLDGGRAEGEGDELQEDSISATIGFEGDASPPEQHAEGHAGESQDDGVIGSPTPLWREPGQPPPGTGEVWGKAAGGEVHQVEDEEQEAGHRAHAHRELEAAALRQRHRWLGEVADEAPKEPG